MLAKNATAQMKTFEQLCSENTILPVTEAIISQAANIYADLYRRGELISDADILIAATALVHDYVLVTNNESHMRRVVGLQVENWLE
jgi:predicted nucleic acid-binding protein